jgi:multiple sugar transport system substrate-binding protein
MGHVSSVRSWSPPRGILGIAATTILTILAMASMVAPAVAQDDRASGTVRVWTFLDPNSDNPRAVALKSLIDSFEAANPDVDIVVEPQPPESIEAQFLAISQAGAPPDITWMVDNLLPGIWEAGALADLNTLLSTEFQETAIPDLVTALADKAVFGGQRAALPLWPNAGTLVFYRDDLLEAAGASEPPTDWAAFADLAAQLSGDETVGLGVYLDDFTDSLFLIMMYGFPPGVIDPVTGKFDLLGPEAMQVAQLIRDMYADGAIAQDAVTATLDDVQDQFAAGRFAMSQAYGPRFSTFQSTASAYDPAQLKFAKFPSFDGADQPSIVGYWTVGIPSGAANPEAAAAFLEHMYSVEGSLTWSQLGGQLPDRQSALADPWYATPEAGALAQMAELASSPGTRSLPQGQDSPDKVFSVLNVATQALIGTDRPIEEILTEAKEELGW